MSLDQTLLVVRELGFPVVVSLYLLIRHDRLLCGIREELHQLRVLIGGNMRAK